MLILAAAETVTVRGNDCEFIYADNHNVAVFPFGTVWLIGNGFFRRASFSRNA